MRRGLHTALSVAIPVFAAACGSNSSGPAQQGGSPPRSSGASSGADSGSTSGSSGESGTSGSSASSGGGMSSNSSGGSSSDGGASSGSSGSGGDSSSDGGVSSGSSGSGSSSGSGVSSGSSDGGSGSSSGSLGDAGPCSPASIVTYPTLPGAVQSPLYKVAVNGTSAFVEQLTKFAPEMQVHYAHFSVSNGCTATISVTANTSFSSYTVSPKSRNISATKSGNTITFSSGPNYLILQFDSQELLFILIDSGESNPPRVGDANVKNIADYNVDNAGGTLVTSQVQAAINAASGATQNILYVPPGKYLVGELSLKSNMTLYLAGGAVLYGSNSTGDFNTVSGGVNIEGTQHGLIRMSQISNAKILGRGVLDANGKSIRAQGLNANLMKIEGSSNILIDGIIVRDSSYWNTLVYQSDLVTIQNYKVINCRPTTTTFNNTDGVDYVESTNGHLSNAFLYTGDDNMAPKNEFAGGHNLKNVLHENIVCYSNSVCAKIGTNTQNQTIDGIVYRDIDVVKAGRALAIDAYDTAVVQNSIFENIRIEAADSNIIDLDEDMPPTWRTAANMSVTNNTTFTNVTSDVKKPIILHGKSATVNISGVHFGTLTVQGNVITSDTDPNASWDINSFVSNITVGP